MPFPFSRRSKSTASTSPEISQLNRPLIYAQSTNGDNHSIASTNATAASMISTDGTSNVFVDSTYLKEQQGAQRLATSNNSESTEPAGVGGEPFERPTTPPQGSRILPWESYRDLPADHPVFRYPDEVRENFYKKGIDPVTRAEMDYSQRGILYGDKKNSKRQWSKFGSGFVGGVGSLRLGQGQ